MALTRLRILVAGAVLAGALVLPGAASAGSCPVCDQYQENVPGAGGWHYPNDPNAGGGNHGGGSGTSGGLSDATQQQLEQNVSAPVASALETVASSPALGAPQTTLVSSKTGRHGSGGNGNGGGSADRTANDGSATGGGASAGDASSAAGPASPLAELVGAGDGSSGGHLLGIVLGLVAITAAAAAAAYLRRRSTS